ncbi:hypothetical protein AB0J55_00295 [Amycolatopsis sp. NPDC049688]|uniref:helix-turn-helix transcriptional regulator n=1 Tax=Amycolatopsis sp. NPDC049688 TaxID=3154733 RepID=UPI00341FF014
MINDTVGRPGSWLDARSLMDQAAREDAAELEEHGVYQPTLADDAKRAYEHFKIGVWHLEQDDPREALRWLRAAVELDVVEAEPLLQLCLQALESVPAGREAHDDEHEAEAAELQAYLSATECDWGPDDEPSGEATPIYDAVADGVGDNTVRFWKVGSYSTSTRIPRLDRTVDRTVWNPADEAAPPLDVEFEVLHTESSRPFVYFEGHTPGVGRLDFVLPGMFDSGPAALGKLPERLVVLYACVSAAPDLRLRHWCDDLAQGRSGLTTWSEGRTESGLLLPPGGEALTLPRVPAQHAPVALDGVERRVAFLVARGMSGVDIADELGLPYATAMAHFARACRKLGVTGRDGLRAALGSGDEWGCRPDGRVAAPRGA